MVALGPRAQQLLFSIARGQSSEEIARELAITRATVKVHIKNLFRKLEVSNRVQAVRVGRQLGLLPDDPDPAPPPRRIKLRSEEKLLLKLAARSLTYAEMARKLGWTTRQVKYSMALLFPRLGVSRRDLAVLKALHLGLIRDPGLSKTAARARI